MATRDSYSYSELLYKTKDEPGWHYELVKGTKEEVLERCKTLGYFAYTVNVGGTAYGDFSVVKSCHTFSDIYKYSNLIFHKSLGRWFLPGEIIPIPETSAERKDFKVDFIFEDDLNEDLDDYYDESLDEAPTFFSHPEITITAGASSESFGWKYMDSYVSKFKGFKAAIDECGFASVDLEDYADVQFLAWDMGSDIRFLWQEYGSTRVVVVMDIVIDKESFFTTLFQALNGIQKQHDTYKAQFNRDVDSIGKYQY